VSDSDQDKKVSGAEIEGDTCEQIVAISDEAASQDVDALGIFAKYWTKQIEEENNINGSLKKKITTSKLLSGTMPSHRVGGRESATLYHKLSRRIKIVAILIVAALVAEIGAVSFSHDSILNMQIQDALEAENYASAIPMITSTRLFFAKDKFTQLLQCDVKNHLAGVLKPKDDGSGLDPLYLIVLLDGTVDVDYSSKVSGLRTDAKKKNEDEKNMISAAYSAGTNLYYLTSAGNVLPAPTNHDNSGENGVAEWENISYITGDDNVTLGVTKDGTILVAGTMLTAPAYDPVLDENGAQKYEETQILWSTNVLGSSTYTTLQGDGNFVVYSGDAAIWSSGTNGTGLSKLVVEDTGMLNGYNENFDFVWSATPEGSLTYSAPDANTPVGTMLVAGQQLQVGESIISDNGDYRLEMQSDGNLVLSKIAKPIPDQLKLDENGNPAEEPIINPVTEQPYDISSWTDIKTVSIKDDFLLGQKKNGTIVTMGNPYFEFDPAVLEEWADIESVSLGDQFIIGKKNDGTIAIASTKAPGGLEKIDYDVADFEIVHLPPAFSLMQNEEDENPVDTADSVIVTDARGRIHAYGTIAQDAAKKMPNDVFAAVKWCGSALFAVTENGNVYYTILQTEMYAKGGGETVKYLGFSDANSSDGADYNAITGRATLVDLW
jgi:hypothetical protein